MTGRSRLNLVLAVLLAGLGAAVYFSQEKEEKNPPLTPLTAETIDRVQIEHPGAPAIRLEKRDGQWALTQPIQVEADKFEVNGVLALATLERKKALDAVQVQLAELGLAPPAYSVTLNDTRVDIGGTEPLSYQRYVQVTAGDAKQLALADDPPGAALDQDYSDLVGKSLLPSGAEIQKIEVPGLSVARGADGHWQLSPPDAAASADQMQKFADAWKNARSMWNQLEADKALQGESASVRLKDGRVLRFIIAGRDPQLQLTRADLGIRYNLSKALVDEMLELPTLPEPAKADATAVGPGLDALVPPAPASSAASD